MGAWRGLCWRYVPRGAQPLNVGHIFQASGRRNRRGEFGALYLAETQAGALAERSRYLAGAGVARAAGFFALRVPSAALAGACNIIIYPDAYPVATIVLRDGPDRIAL